ncbi:MAG: RNA polymerase subunit sigma-70 [Thalassospira sp.]|uniref:RNA polymerase sigma factor n=1 Tax=Thalassospira sp. TaxID=1912094 RepID=UPI000C3D7B51|nr:RNA polymerase sigma factor [Thalassospira sp.]MAL41364.1 RNA polymerase subunit sigma-70 [Thalassospira sp.]
MASKPDTQQLFRQYGEEVRRFLARKLSCADTAEDLTQETFARLLRIDSDIIIEDGRAFIYKTANNLAIDHIRAQRRRRTDPTDHDTMALIADERPNAETQTGDRRRLKILQQAIAELPPRTREIFVLGRIEGYSYGAIAQKLSVSESTVQKHLATALAHAVTKLKKHQAE